MVGDAQSRAPPDRGDRHGLRLPSGSVARISVTGDTPTFLVEVHDGDVTTSHTVTVPGGLAASLGWTDDAALVKRSFEFLLAREPATSILRRFSLDVIGKYFPEYTAEVSGGHEGGTARR